MKTRVLLYILFIFCTGNFRTNAFQNETNTGKVYEHEVSLWYERKIDVKKTTWTSAMSRSGDWLMKGLTGHVLRNVLENYSETDISTECKRDMDLYENGLKEWKRWAVHMADSTAKIPPSLLYGTRLDYGSFDQCLATRSVNFQGQYCLVGHSSSLISSTKRRAKGPYLRKYGTPPDWVKDFLSEDLSISVNESLWLGTCMPSTCLEGDIQKMYSSVASAYNIDVNVTECQIDEPKKMSLSGKIALTALLFVLSLSVVGSIWDVWISPATEEKGAWKNESILSSVMRAFSITRRVKRFEENWKRETPFDFMHGLRELATWLIVFGHAYMYPEPNMAIRRSNFGSIKRLLGSATIIIDSSAALLSFFFFISGFMLPISVWGTLQKNNGKINIIRFLLNRPLRYMPTFLLAVALFMIVPNLSRAPLWNGTWEYFTSNCEKRIWTNFLFISNFWPVDNQCITQSWVMAAIIQCDVLGIIVMIVLYKRPKWGVALAFAITSACCSWAFCLSRKYNLAAPLVVSYNDPHYMKFYAFMLYEQVYTHIGSYFLGIMCLFLTAKNMKTKLSKTQQFFGWTFGISCLVSIIVLIRKLGENQLYIDLYNALYRPFLSLGLVWICFACCTGNGGFINKIFTWRPLVFTSNISFTLSMLHPILFVYNNAISKERMHADNTTFIYTFASVYAMSFFLAILGHLLVEAPFNEINRMLIVKKEDYQHSPLEHSKSEKEK